jgi:hypothetical protein
VVFIDSGTEVKVIDVLGNSPNVMKGAPESLRQIWQWQLVKDSGKVVLEYFTWPH